MFCNATRKLFVLTGLVLATTLAVVLGCATPAPTPTAPPAAATSAPPVLTALPRAASPSPAVAASPTSGAGAAGGGTAAATKPAGGATASPATAVSTPSGSGTGGTTGDAARGQQVFNSRGCTGCHTIGGGTLVGPDLKGVTVRRDKDWIARFIANPGQVIASGDPTATQLVQQYGRQMPNLNLNPQDVSDLIAYLDTQK